MVEDVVAHAEIEENVRVATADVTWATLERKEVRPGSLTRLSLAVVLVVVLDVEVQAGAVEEVTERLSNEARVYSIDGAC